jgi:hypothetical protein
MRLTPYLRRLPLVVGATFMAAASTGVTMAWAQGGPGTGPIRPHQPFLGLINGNDGVNGPVTINMACYGPVKPGQTGHPMAGQSVGVAQPEVIEGTFGNTGSRGTSIGAFFGAPPPTASAGSVVFHHYGTRKMPTSLMLPCSGSGTVTFVALPMSPSERSFGVPVTFAGQP